MNLEHRKSIFLILLSSIIVILFLVGSFLKNSNNDIYTFKKEYEEYNGVVVKEKTKYIDVNINVLNSIFILDEDEIMDAINHETGIFYFGFPTCPWCRNIVEPLLKVAKEQNVKIYYMNPREVRAENSLVYQQLLKKLSGNLQKNENGEETLYVPDVYFVKNGKIIGHHMGTVESQTNPYQKINKSEQKELENLYTNLVKKIK